MTRPKQIALAFPIGVPYMERITKGVIEYARRQKKVPWQLVFNPEAMTIPLESIEPREVDGILAFVSARNQVKQLAALGVPAVNLASAIRDHLIPTVTVENHAVGRLAAQHLIDRGFRHFAYYGVGDVAYGRDRGEGFSQAVHQAGFQCSSLHVHSDLGQARLSLSDLQQLRTWLRGLSVPVGLLAVHDYRARVVLEACAAIGLRVPDDVAVIGVDDDVVLCELTTPTLTSVALPGFEIGHRAAQLLERLMEGESVPDGPVLVSPVEIVNRRSTDVLACEDRAVAEVVRLINERIREPLNVAQVAEEVSVSRRVLERRFKSALGMTPHEYLCRARVDRAKRLLLGEPPPTLKEVAAASGFTDARRMNLVFRRLEGIPPQTYRMSRGEKRRQGH